MKIKIKVASLYNDANHQAVACEVGDTLVTGNAYGLSLIDAGLADIFEEAPVLEGEEPAITEGEPEADTEAKTKKPVRSSAKAKSNPFAPQ
jgi:hypothetical protein